MIQCEVCKKKIEFGELYEGTATGEKHSRPCVVSQFSKDVAEYKQLHGQHSLKDMVNHPPHYNNGKVECIDAIEAATTGLTGFEAYNTGTIIKYMWRWKLKNGVEDLKKAVWYLNKLIVHLEDKTNGKN